MCEFIFPTHIFKLIINFVIKHSILISHLIVIDIVYSKVNN